MNQKLVNYITKVFMEAGKTVHDPEQIKLMKDAGKSQDWIDGAHQMYHVIEAMMAPAMRIALMEATLEAIKEAKEQQDKVKAEVSQLDEADSKVQGDGDISDDVKSLLLRFKGPMQ